MTPWQEMFLMYLGIAAGIGTNVYAVIVVTRGRAAVESLASQNKELQRDNEDMQDSIQQLKEAFASHTGITINGRDYRKKEAH